MVISILYKKIAFFLYQHIFTRRNIEANKNNYLH